MFTGVIEKLGLVSSISASSRSKRLSIHEPYIAELLKEGSSIAVNGVCLTATKIERGAFSADLSEETWTRTALYRLRHSSYVNLELPLLVNANGRLDGHIVQGHVDGVGTFIGIDGSGDLLMRIKVPPDLDKYVVFKGSIAIEGVSLTVVNFENRIATISVIPHTIKMTNFTQLHRGDPVNIETDIIAKYLEKWFSAGLCKNPTTDESFLVGNHKLRASRC